MSARLSAAQQAILSEMGIEVWLQRGQNQPTESDESVTVPATAVDRSVAETFIGLNKEMLTCTRCALHQSRVQAVCGVGNLQADVLVVGDAPGAAEDQQGEPFVDGAGQLLNEMLRAVGWQRDAVFLANVLKCRLPEGQEPLPAEVASCMPFLQRQIGLVKPKLIIAVGQLAAQSLLNVATPLSSLRGQVHAYGELQLPVVVTYHPAELLQSPLQKAGCWSDLLLALDTLAARVT